MSGNVTSASKSQHPCQNTRNQSFKTPKSIQWFIILSCFCLNAHPVHFNNFVWLYSFCFSNKNKTYILFFLSDWQTQNQATSPAPSTSPSTPSCLPRVTSCLKTNSRSSSPWRAWTPVVPCASCVALPWLHATWRWLPTSAATRRCPCTTARGRSGTPEPCRNTSYLKAEGNTCDCRPETGPQEDRSGDPRASRWDSTLSCELKDRNRNSLKILV